MSLENRGVQWRALRRHVFHRDDYKCRACGRRGRRLECDHVIPRKDGGTEDPANLQTLCRDCHIAKTEGEKGDSYAGKAEWAEFVNASPYERRRA